MQLAVIVSLMVALYLVLKLRHWRPVIRPLGWVWPRTAYLVLAPFLGALLAAGVAVYLRLRWDDVYHPMDWTFSSFRQHGGWVAPWDDSQHPIAMRYQAGHKAEIHQKIVKDASRRVRAEGLNGAAVATVMRDTGLTHGGFYKHFGSKDELLVESLREGFREIIDTLVRAAEQSPPREAWKAIVKTYLRPEMCEHPEHGCPLASLAPELARVDKRMKPQIVAELVNYKNRMGPFMPGRRTVDKERAFFAIFATMVGAVEIARMLPDPVREKVLESARDFLLRSF